VTRMQRATACSRPAYLRFGYGLILVIGAFAYSGLSLSAQVSGSQTTQELPDQWQSTTDQKSDHLLPERLPVRIVESHCQNGDLTLNKRTIEIRGTDRHLETYQDIEVETRKVDASTVRTTIRTFARDVNGRKSLVQVTEEEKHILRGNDSNVVRATYNPDVNGKLQLVQREIVETRTIRKDLQETNTTVMLPSVDGGVTPAFKTRETRTQLANDILETEKTTWLPDVNGKWQVGEIRKDISTQEAKHLRSDETVFRSDADGKLHQMSRSVSHESESSPGEKQSSTEVYSIDLPGATRDGNLHLVERVSISTRTDANGGQTTTEMVEQPNPGDPGAGLRASVLVDNKFVPVEWGQESTITIRARDSNDTFGIVSIDTTKSERGNE